MTDTTDQQAVTVAQADREAATLYWQSQDIGSPETYAQIRAGRRDDSHLIRAFARHRLASVSSASAEGGERYRHVKRGTVYGVVGRAELQVATYVRPGEGQTLVVYRGDDGKLWAREESEFMDGRFEPVAASPEPVPATNQAGEDVKAQDPAALLAHLQRMPMTEWIWHDASMIFATLSALATQPATSQEGEDEDAIHDCGNLGWCQAPGCCSRHGTAPTPTPPTLSEDLREALREIRDTTTAVAGLDRDQTEEYYRSIARAALAQVKAS